MDQSTVRKGRGQGLENLRRSIKSLGNSSVSFGHYKGQPKHYSGMSFVALLRLWAVGGPNLSQPVRNSRAAARLRLREWANDPEMRRAFRRWAANPRDRSDPDLLMVSFGKFLKEKYKMLFGRVGPFMPPDSNATPLLETGALRAGTRFRTNRGGLRT